MLDLEVAFSAQPVIRLRVGDRLVSADTDRAEAGVVFAARLGLADSGDARQVPFRPAPKEIVVGMRRRSPRVLRGVGATIRPSLMIATRSARNWASSM